MQELKQNFRDFDKNFCSLKWAQRLKEIGIRQDTMFHYVWDEKNTKYEICWSSNSYDEEHYSAYTVQDFVDLFPKLFKFARSDSEWKFYCEYADMHLKDENKLADVFARILVAITKTKDASKPYQHRVEMLKLEKERNDLS
jgi:hypothetical protein